MTETAEQQREGEARTDVDERILIVDDVPDNVEIIATRLRFNGYEVDEATDGPSAIERVREVPPDLILLDVMMPEMDGYETARRIREDESLPYIPIILVTAKDSTEDKVTGLDSGADDYLTKPINFPELEARVRSMLRIKDLQDELGEKNKQLEEKSIRDGLTELFNYRHIQDLLEEEFERSNRTGDELSVAMFDLDHFKQVNDTHGHPAGDRVLEQLAVILRKSAREIDRLGRYGGEEFIVVLPETELDQAVVFVERIRERVEAHEFDIGADEPLAMTISAGVARGPEPEGDEPSALVERADQALYAAKEGGRNRVERYDDMRDPDAAERR